MVKSVSTEGKDDIPPLEELNSLLDELATEGGSEDSGLDLAEAETELAAEEDQLPFDEDSEAGSLDQLLAIASRYPGLKITLSF